MKVAIYPGSFNPWHEGHTDILRKSLKMFDEVLIGAAQNPMKPTGDANLESSIADKLADSCVPLGLHRDVLDKYVFRDMQDKRRVHIISIDGLLADRVNQWNYQNDCENCSDQDIVAVIRGLRNGHDLEYEINNQFWNEDLGLKVPFVYFITDRKYIHYSSSAIRAIEKVKGRKHE